MRTLSVERLRHLHEELCSINKRIPGVSTLSAFDRDIQQALKELLTVKQANKTAKKTVKRVPVKATLANLQPVVGKVTLPSYGAYPPPLPGTIRYAGMPTVHSATCPRCGESMKSFLPFQKKACDTCAREKITILLTSQ